MVHIEVYYNKFSLYLQCASIIMILQVQKETWLKTQ